MPVRAAAATLRKSADRVSASSKHANFEPVDLTWHDDAPAALQELRGPADSPSAWPVWKRHLARRSRPRGLVRRLARSHRPLLWGTANGGANPSVAQWAQRLWSLVDMRDPLANELAGAAAEWLEPEAEGDARDEVAYSLQLLAWCYLLPRLSRKLPPGIWWGLVQRCIAAARSAETAPARYGLLVAQLRAVELPLALSVLLPEIDPCRQLADAAASVELPKANPLIESRAAVLASWTRSLALAQAGRVPVPAAIKRQRFRKQLRTVLCLDGCNVEQQLFVQAARLGGGKSLRRAVRAAHRSGGRKSPRISHAQCPASLDAPAESLAVMRCDWQCASPRLRVDYRQSEPLVELTVGNRTLLAGAWRVAVSRDAEPLAPLLWEHVHWESTVDVDYLVLSATLPGQCRIERQIVLARRDQFLLLADTVLGDGEGPIDYTATLPLSGGVTLECAADTREARLVAKEPQALVLPLALPEWRSDARYGTLSAVDGRLELQQTGHGPALYAALWFDLDARRLDRPLTWRQLTVAQERKIVPRQVAAGFRVQVGNKQWLAYRSLGAKALRTVLGQNLNCDFLLARFRRSGRIRRFVHVPSSTNSAR